MSFIPLSTVLVLIWFNLESTPAVALPDLQRKVSVISLEMVVVTNQAAIFSPELLQE